MAPDKETIRKAILSSPDDACTVHPILSQYVLDLNESLHSDIIELNTKVDELKDFMIRQTVKDESERQAGAFANSVFIALLSASLGFLFAVILKLV